jgi:hypothetical protein
MFERIALAVDVEWMFPIFGKMPGSFGIAVKLGEGNQNRVAFHNLREERFVFTTVTSQRRKACLRMKISQEYTLIVAVF